MAKVALVFGGPSGEHDVSLVSAKNIYGGLKHAGHSVLLLGITKQGEWKRVQPDELLTTSFDQPIDLSKIGTSVSLINTAGKVELIESKNRQSLETAVEVAFPICHGPFGEDGRLQGYFELLQLPYVGSGTKSCAVCLDKIHTKSVIENFGIPQAPFFFSHKPDVDLDQVLEKFKFPLFVKPANMGSSVGISKVKTAQDWPQAIKEAFRYDNKIIIEQGLDAQEVEVAVLEKGGEIAVTGTCEITSRHDFYSYEAKYLDENGAQFTYPANISAVATEKIREYATTAFKALECKHYARADFFVAANDEVYFNEINTHPGFTAISQFPSLWAREGMPLDQLVDYLVSSAIGV